MKAASCPGGTCPHKKNEHQLPRDLQKERGNEITQGMERSVDRGRESSSWFSLYLVLCLDKNIGEKGVYTFSLLTRLSSPPPSRALFFFFFSVLEGKGFPHAQPHAALSLSLSRSIFSFFSEWYVS